ncbi:MAG: hypothetical protein WBP81_03625 [Solirubrobacteraceae bacterium]
MEDPHQRSAQRRRRVGIEGIGLGLHRPACAGESESPEALRHEPPCPHGAAGGQETILRLGTQPVGHRRRERALGVPHVPRGQLPGQRRELMHDHLGLGGRHRLGDRVGVQSVGHDRARSQTAHQVLLRCAPGHPDHLVASRHELRDERSAENARGARYKDLHDCSSRLTLHS